MPRIEDGLARVPKSYWEQLDRSKQIYNTGLFDPTAPRHPRSRFHYRSFDEPGRTFLELDRFIRADALEIGQDRWLVERFHESGRRVKESLKKFKPTLILSSGNSVLGLLPAAFPEMKAGHIAGHGFVWFNDLDAGPLYKNRMGIAGEHENYELSIWSLRVTLVRKFGSLPDRVTLLDDYIGGATKAHTVYTRLLHTGVQEVHVGALWATHETQIITPVGSTEAVFGDFIKNLARTLSFLAKPEDVERYIRGDAKREAEIAGLRRRVGRTLSELKSK